MTSDPNRPISADNGRTFETAPPPSAAPPIIAPTQPAPAPKTPFVRRAVLVLLSLFLGLFLLDGAVSLLDDSFGLVLGAYYLTVMRTLVSVLAVFMALVIYGLMGLTPMIPKRFFLPLVWFYPVVLLASLPGLIYFFARAQQITWVISAVQVALGLLVLYRVRGTLKPGGALIPDRHLGARGFSWLNLLGFAGANLLLCLPAVVAYCGLCAALAVDHFSSGFLSLRPAGLVVQARKYVRDDGKTIQLIPMAHVGDARFYQQLARDFPTNALVLMEGVSDSKNLLTNKISYTRLASSLGLAEQKKEFKPDRTRSVMADVDVDQFSTNTIALLNLVISVHAQGMKPETLQKLSAFNATWNIQSLVLEDLLQKRNQHVLEEIKARLEQSENLIVPWGAAHMPGIAAGIEKAGFHVGETRQYVIIRFHS